jgi:hypothetical protein
VIVSSCLERPVTPLAKKVATQNGHERLEDAMAMLIQNQAAFVQNQTTCLSRMAESDRRHAELERATEERFARIERDMTAILRVLAENGRMLQQLPDAVRGKTMNGYSGAFGSFRR